MVFALLCLYVKRQTKIHDFYHDHTAGRVQNYGVSADCHSRTSLNSLKEFYHVWCISFMLYSWNNKGFLVEML